MKRNSAPLLTASVKKQRKQAVLNKLVERRPSPMGGDGLFALASFKLGQPIASYDGELISAEEAERRFASGQPAAHYQLDFRGGSIAPDISALGAHVANHSCAANSFLKNAPFHDRPVLFAMSPVSAGDEVTHWYGWSHEQPLECRCGARACLGTIGIKAGKLDQREIERIIAVAEQNSNWMMLSSLIEASPDAVFAWLSSQHAALLARYKQQLRQLMDIIGFW
jgi:SET domain-containing protein